MTQLAKMETFSPRLMAREAGLESAFDEAVLIQRTSLLLIEMREKAGLTVEELADRLRQSPQYVLELESGRYVDPLSVSLLLRIADACGVHLSPKVRQIL
jgi:ribosome-binding protein aMBF1 (putative translation factor)